MDVFFADPKLEEMCASHRQLVRMFGSDNAARIEMRLQHLTEADSLQDLQLLGGRLHSLKADRAGQFALDLKHPRRLVFVPVGVDEPYDDWSEIRSIEILEIVDYH
ncbi:hypothetical protein [Curtobacterium sp. BRD11]|uniref:type II toxin-antitoxin system RelE/ParE family toxin n=1 Tax=Curtobacterium sp. BRD11 TaxID=2962581 RepID=UPI0028820A48|nr:hypothetical protein [Curtobacterium sp. BRD11]MDT0212054.1 hypothetical protein [Curtobacterium sp. BRD11]